jgi:hypothetical protein
METAGYIALVSIPYIANPLTTVAVLIPAILTTEDHVRC